MTAADLRTLAEVLDRPAAAGFAVGPGFVGGVVIRAEPVAPLAAQGEPFSDGTRFTDGTGWVEGRAAQGATR